jgi:phytoene dehydrogenase-like protein
MGAVSGALAGAGRDAGAELRCGAEVTDVDPESGEVTWTEAGEEHGCRARWVVENRAVNGHHPAAEGSQTKVNMLLDRLPRLRSGVTPEDAFTGTFRVNESEPDLQAAYAQAAAGELPARPPAELYCHSLTDRSILAPDAPPERQTLTLFGLQTPARLFADDNEGVRDTLVERYLDGLDEHLADPIRDCLARDADGELCLEAKTPLDVERELRMPGGNIFHGDLAFPWAESAGDAGGWGCETEHERVVVAGAGALRGGGVSGIGGHNAAMAVLERARRRSH